MNNAPELSPELFAQLWGEALQLYPDARVVPGLACTEVARMAYFAGWEARGTAEDSLTAETPPGESIRTALERLLERLDETREPGDPAIPAWIDSYAAARAALMAEGLPPLPAWIADRCPPLLPPTPAEGEVAELVGIAAGVCAHEGYDDEARACHRAAALLQQQAAELERLRVAIPREEYHEDFGPVTWWRFPVVEPAWIGWPTDSDWPGYHTHFTPHPAEPALPLPSGEATNG